MPKSEILILILIFSLSLFLHFGRLDIPDRVVFDEQWYSGFASKYFTGQYYFDAHPPLGKMLIAFTGKIFGAHPDPNFDYKYPHKYPNKETYLPFRILPALLGSFLPILGWLIVKEFGGSKIARGMASSFLLFDSAMMLESRLILLEIILVFFILLSFYFYFKFKNQKVFSRGWYIYLVLCGISLGCCISIKWTSGGIFLAILLLEGIYFDRKKNQKNFLKKEVIFEFCAFILIPLVIYILVFAMHFYLLPNLNETVHENGRLVIQSGDNFFVKFIKLNFQMMSIINTESHPYQSSWFSWPLGAKTIYYYHQENVHLALVANPMVWCFAFIFLLYFVLQAFAYEIFPGEKTTEKDLFFKRVFKIVPFYIFSYFPFMLLTNRATFLYYYFTPLCFSIFISVLYFDFLIKKESKQNKILISTFIILVCILFFIYFSPMIYAFPLDKGKGLNNFTLPFWRSW